MEPRISIITLGVSDLEVSRRFYRDGLGLPLRPGPEGMEYFADPDGHPWEVAWNPHFQIE